MKILKICILSVIGLISKEVLAQDLDVNLQLRPRYEMRNGYKSLLPIGQAGTSFIGQRSRFDINFKEEKLKVKLTLQNVSTWGDVPINTTSSKNGIALFEGWAQYNLDDTWSIKLGRQVLSYDNQRVIGGLDWANSGQSHDAALIRFKPKNHQLDLGVALNSTGENILETAYDVSNYKTMQFAWYHTQIEKLGISALFLNTGYEFTNVNTELEVDYKQTFGTYLTYKNNKINSDLGFYGQTGKSNDFSVGAWYAGANFGYSITDTFNANLGFEYLSGKDMDDVSTKIKSFQPIFGTNHGFNGYMDYFYVGNHTNNVGLEDIFLKLNYHKDKWQFALTPHLFYAPNKVVSPSNEEFDSYLGTELDFSLGYTIRKDIVATGGYSQMFGSKTLELLKAGDAGHTNNWAWLQVSINPRIFTLNKK